MKSLVTALLFFACSGGVHAQLRTAVAGGLNRSSVLADVNPGWDTVDYNYGARTGFRAGLLIDVPLSANSNFYLQPAMFFSNKGRNLSRSYDSSTSVISRVSAQQFVNYMELPVNLLFKAPIGGKTQLVLGAGPYISFLYNGKEKKDIYLKSGDHNSTVNTDMKRARPHGEYNNFDFGVNALAGVEIGRFFMTANYSQGLDNFYKAHQHSGDFKHQVVGATAGIFLDKRAGRQTSRRDRDNDGVPDVEDKCRFKPGSVATGGCPDSDGDGIIDKLDDCPNAKGSFASKGCPVPDTDGDGINDEEDKCPQTAGSKASNGCPEIEAFMVNEVNIRAGKIQFKYSSSMLTADSKIALDGIVNILKDNRDLDLTIEGFTSTDGTGHNHTRLSQARADQVKKYLVSQGIESFRIKATGLGTARQLNGNKTEAERSMNRRVELKLRNR